jgi:hypothetical protein
LDRDWDLNRRNDLVTQLAWITDRFAGKAASDDR